MSELDEQALEAAGKSLVNVLWDEQMPTADVVARMVVSAYLSAAAARPTPDAAAWQPMDDDALQAMTARIRNGEADEDEQARFSMTNMMFIIHQWASGAVDATNQQAYAAALLRHAESVNKLYRKAVRS